MGLGVLGATSGPNYELGNEMAVDGWLLNAWLGDVAGQGPGPQGQGLGASDGA
jgi:hypothetical protein